MKWILKFYICVGVGIITVHCSVPLLERKRFCFDDYNQDQPEAIHRHLACGKEGAKDETPPYQMKMVNVEYWRPNDKGDRSCQMSEDAKCCDLWVNDTIKCVVPVDQAMVEDIVGHCEGQSECVLVLKATQLGQYCKENCNDDSPNAANWCWSRILVVDYLCYTEVKPLPPEEPAISTTFIIVVCVLIPVCLLIGAALPLIVIKMKKKGYHCCHCLTKKMYHSTNFHANTEPAALPRHSSEPNTYFVEAGAAASGVSQQGSRRTAGRNSFAIEPMYCDTEEMLSIRDSMNTDNYLAKETTFSKANQHMFGAMSDMSGTRSRATGKVNSVNECCGEDTRRLSSESGGIQFDASPSPPERERKVSIVKEMVDNPFYKSLGELYDLPEESFSTRHSSFSDTFNTDIKVDLSDVRQKKVTNNVGEDANFENEVKEGNYVRPKSFSLCNPGNYTAVNVPNHDRVRPKSFSLGDPGNFSTVNVSNHDVSDKDEMLIAGRNTLDSSLDLPLCFREDKKRSVSPGLYVHISEETNTGHLRQLEMNADDDTERSAADDLVILPIRKRDSKDQSRGMRNQKRCQSMESVTSSESSFGSSSVSDNNDIKDRYMQASDAGDSKVTTTAADDEELDFCGTGDLECQAQDVGQHAMKDVSMKSNGEEIKLPTISITRTSSSSSESYSDSPRSVCSSDPDIDNYTPVINAKCLHLEIDKGEIELTELNGGVHNLSEQDNHLNGDYAMIVENGEIKPAVITDGSHSTSDNYELTQHSQGNSLACSNCVNDAKFQDDKISGGPRNSSVTTSGHFEEAEAHDTSSSSDDEIELKDYKSVDVELNRVKLPTKGRSSIRSSASSSDSLSEEEPDEVDSDYMTPPQKLTAKT